MPKLLLFAPCEKVIVDRETNNTSLISLLESLNIQVKRSETDKIPPDAQIPLPWHILTLWQSEPGDESKTWEQRVLVDLPQALDVTLKIAFEPGKPNYRNILSIVGFPIRSILNLDRCMIKLFIREEEGRSWELKAEYPIAIRHPKGD